MEKPKHMTDEQWGRLLAERSLGPLSEPSSSGSVAILIIVAFLFMFGAVVLSNSGGW